MAPTTSTNFHNTFSSLYTRNAAGATALVAQHILRSITPRISRASHILDSACGPGIVTQQIKAACPEAKITCADLSPKMIDEVRKLVEAEKLVDVRTTVLDMADLKGLEDGFFSHVVVNFGIGSNPEDSESPQKAVGEVWRVLSEGGVGVVTNWADRSFDKALDATARIVRPAEEPQGWKAPADWSRGSWMMRLFEDAGFGNKVKVESVVTYAEGESEQLVDSLMFMGSMAWFKTYDDDEKKRSRAVLKEEMRKMPTFEDLDGGRARYAMVAWVGWGWK